MKQTFTQKPIVPAGYTGRNFNQWQKKLQVELDKIKRTNVSKRMVA